MSSNGSPVMCRVCGGTGHKLSKCKELGLPPEGFFKPSGGGGHCHDEDDDCDERVAKQIALLYKQLVQSLTVKRLF
jgi:hypothetical protein